MHSPYGLVLFCLSLKNLLVLIYSNLHSKSCDYLYKLYSFNNQDDRSTRFLCKTNYGIDLIIKRFHEENSTSGLFSKNNLLLSGMQGNNGLAAKTLKNF